MSRYRKKYLRNNKISFQIFLPHTPHTNAAKKAIGTVKYYFFTGLCSVHPNFPMHLWCRLILITTTNFNLLHPSRINPKLWTKELLDGAFNYNKIPLTPPGYKIILHDSPEKHGPWEPYGVDGWYFGAAPEHCTAFLCCEPCKDRIARTVEFFPQYFAMTNTS